MIGGKKKKHHLADTKKWVKHASSTLGAFACANTDPRRPPAVAEIYGDPDRASKGGAKNWSGRAANKSVENPPQNLEYVDSDVSIINDGKKKTWTRLRFHMW